MQSRVHKRLHREYKEMLKNYSDFFRMQMKDDSMLLLEVSFVCAEGTVFAREAFTLQYTFDQNYPTEAPEVIFVKRFLDTSMYILTGITAILFFMTNGPPA